MTRAVLLASSLLVVLVARAAAPPPSAVTPDPDGPRPIAARDSVFIEELTWMEVRDALDAGKSTILVATGGVEQNGPYLAAGKHNYILRATTEAIARKLGNALVAPLVPFVPEGEIDPPTEHMKYPSTVSISEDTYERLLTEICECFRVHGFVNIVLLGDSGGNQEGLRAVAERLNAKWSGGAARAHYIPEYYDYAGIKAWLDEQGIEQTDEGLHDDFAITAQMMVVDPSTVRMDERLAKDCFRINGVDLAPAEQTIAWGRRIVEFRAERTVEAIHKALAAGN
jgi:creatinine amidohydrolase/Fe(II)-dependent formamide hydrolase-like protein